MFEKWFSANVGQISLPLKCWDYSYSGYVIAFDKKFTSSPILLKNDKEYLPLFDENNSWLHISDYYLLEWFSQLYYQGYQFEVLSHGWFINLKLA